MTLAPSAAPVPPAGLGSPALPADPDRRVAELLSEPLGACRARQRATFDDLAGPRRGRVVLFGAGGLGRRTLAGLRRAGVEPLAFSDNRAGAWGSCLDGLEVLPPEVAAERYGDEAVFVVTIWRAGGTHRYEETAAQLRGLGVAATAPIAWLSWRYAEELLPFWGLDLPSRVLEAARDVRHAYRLLGDLRSRQEFATQLEWRLFGDPSVLAHPVNETQYLVEEVALPRDDEVVIDCGAYDGDTLRAWLRERGPSFARYVALEPDPITLARLEASLTRLPESVLGRITVLPYAVGNLDGEVRFAATGLLSSARSEVGVPVRAVRLDDLGAVLAGAVPTMLKVDIEGGELELLAGGSGLIASARPLVAMAAYHRQDHLWRVPLALAELLGGHRFFLRPHNEEGWDLVCYAVPPDRVP